ncbi:unnamed protein product [Caenorhabditis nigoni]
MVPFVFFEAAQAVIMLELVIDVYIIVKLPGLYKTVKTWIYLLTAFIAPSIIGVIFSIWGSTYLDDEEIYFCNPTSSLHTTASKNYTRCIVIINSLTLIIFATLILIFYKKSQNKNPDSTKVMKRLQFSVVIFLCSWYITIFTYYVCLAAGIEGEELHFVINNMTFFICLAYSQTFYAILYKSNEYKNAFHSMLGIKQKPKDLGKNTSTTRIGASQKPTIIF